MPSPTISLTDVAKEALWSHLLEDGNGREQAAFLFVRSMLAAEYVYEVIDWYPVPSSGFASSSAYHFELTDETRGLVIKRAHDLNACLVEAHSHLGSIPPAFSPSDMHGFREWVPHVWLRLKGKPYFAVVISPGGIDGLAWLKGPDSPERLAGLRTESTEISTSRRSILHWDPEHDRYNHE